MKAAFNTKEAAYELGICRSKLFELIREKRIRTVKLGRRNIILKEDLEAFLKSLPTFVPKGGEQ